MTTSSKCISEATLEEEEGNVLILTPLSVLLSVAPVTLIPEIGYSFWYFPRLPMLIPWPGPQVTSLAVKSWVPSQMEMQSSPVPILALLIEGTSDKFQVVESTKIASDIEGASKIEIGHLLSQEHKVGLLNQKASPSLDLEQTNLEAMSNVCNGQFFLSSEEVLL
nr:hypothetical protein CFP56_62338 [Quercus suber]